MVRLNILLLSLVLPACTPHRAATELKYIAYFCPELGSTLDGFGDRLQGFANTSRGKINSSLNDEIYLIISSCNYSTYCIRFISNSREQILFFENEFSKPNENASEDILSISDIPLDNTDIQLTRISMFNKSSSSPYLTAILKSKVGIISISGLSININKEEQKFDCYLKSDRGLLSEVEYPRRELETIY